jgi:hypothetical protein
MQTLNENKSHFLAVNDLTDGLVLLSVYNITAILSEIINTKPACEPEKVTIINMIDGGTVYTRTDIVDIAKILL